MKKKPKEYYQYVGNSIAVGFAESAHDVLCIAAKPLFIAGICTGSIYCVWGLIHMSEQTGFHDLAIGGGVLLCTVFLQPFLRMLSRLYAKAARNRAQAFYDMTRRVPAGWYLENEEDQRRQAQQTNQQKQSQQEFDQQEAYQRYRAYVAETERKLNEQKIRLEREWARLHTERNQFEQQRAMQQKAAASSNMHGMGDFFAGCTDEASRKRRYRALMKIYHPDNMNGDKRMVEEISRQFERRR